MEQRISEVEKEIALQRQTVNNVLIALSETTEALKENSETQNRLIAKFDVYDAKEEYRAKEMAVLAKNQSEILKKVDSYIEDNHDTLKRVKDKHHGIDKFKDSMYSNWGKIASLVVLVALAWVFGLDLSNIKLGN